MPEAEDRALADLSTGQPPWMLVAEDCFLGGICSGMAPWNAQQGNNKPPAVSSPARGNWLSGVKESISPRVLVMANKQRRWQVENDGGGGRGQNDGLTEEWFI
jgi:hypothetical protein